MPWLFEDREWESISYRKQYTHIVSIKWFNRCVRPSATVAAGLLYYIASIATTTAGLPCIKAEDLLDFDYSWLEMMGSAVLIGGIYMGISRMMQELIMWAYTPTERMCEWAGKGRTAEGAKAK